MERRKTPCLESGIPPFIKMTQEVWDIWMGLGDWRGVSTVDVANELIAFVTKVAVADKNGEPLYAKKGDKFVEVHALKKVGKTS